MEKDNIQEIVDETLKELLRDDSAAEAEQETVEEEAAPVEEPVTEESNEPAEETECSKEPDATAEALAGISEQCALILKTIKKDETHDTQVNNLQKRCQEYEEGIVYSRIKGIVQALIKLREDTRRNRNRVEKDLDSDENCLEDWEFDLDLLQQVADDCLVPKVNEEPAEEIDPAVLEELKAEANAVAESFGGSEKTPLKDWSTEQLRLAMVYEKLVAHYDALLRMVDTMQARVQTLCRISDGAIVAQIKQRVQGLHDELAAEAADPLSCEAYLALLNRMMDGMAEILAEYGVVVDNAPGDAYDALTQKVQKVVETEDELFHARTGLITQIPEMKNIAVLVFFIFVKATHTRSPSVDRRIGAMGGRIVITPFFKSSHTLLPPRCW